MHARLYSDETITANLSTLSLEAQKRAERDASKKAAKAQAKALAQEHHRLHSKVLIRRVERNKRKHVTVITGLEAHGLDLKKVAKELGKKFATGSSVTRSSSYAPSSSSGGGSASTVGDGGGAGGGGGGGGTGGGGTGLGEEIVVQGDVGEEILDWILEKYGDLVPNENLEVVEDRKR
ncbi:MAG: hypothetical protein M1823_002672 [Watsoniomyces obsoletus]|nr:MAG: hypothetical protein M1823_002672 [Watsoniomyces obsoletus]